MFNTGDIIVNLETSKTDLENRNFTGFGQGIGHTIADIWFMNAIDYQAWTSENSRIIKIDGSAISSIKIPSTFYTNGDAEEGGDEEPEVNAVNPNSEGIQLKDLDF